ncbi:hypothetical protein MBRA_04565 [Methylobacterium brachiatum]|nr:hypothetical protein MBRA_04565 [Methylobacterium brachiatum]
MKAGSFWPSPSSVATTGARAARTPLRTAADWPPLRACRTTRIQGRPARRRQAVRRAVGGAVIDVDQLEAEGHAGRLDLGHQGGDVAGLVLHGHDDAEGRGAGHGATA